MKLKQIFVGAVSAFIVTFGATAQTTFYTDFTSFSNATSGLVVNDFSTAVDIGNTITFGGPNPGMFTGTRAFINTDPGESMSAGRSLGAISDSGNTFTLVNAVTAFGVFIGDVGDLGFPNTVSVNGVDVIVDFQNSNLNQDFDPFVGFDDILFVGITDATPFTSITIRGTAPLGESFGYDNLITGSINAVPEPATWLMMIVGFAGVGLALRSRRGLVALSLD